MSTQPPYIVNLIFRFIHYIKADISTEMHYSLNALTLFFTCVSRLSLVRGTVFTFIKYIIKTDSEYKD